MQQRAEVVSTHGLLFAGALAFLVFDFRFSIFPLTLRTERIARYVAELPRCALYISGREQHPPRAHYLLALSLFGFLIFLFSIFC